MGAPLSNSEVRASLTYLLGTNFTAVFVTIDASIGSKVPSSIYDMMNRKEMPVAVPIDLMIVAVMRSKQTQQREKTETMTKAKARPSTSTDGR
ncbi:MAG: hypothetical protein NWE75_07150 [Candidatus Bathyarchaeota archaeon]|nr:hypothetical protein [Candidatus Bathyarchaeota archaeon]